MYVRGYIGPILKRPVLTDHLYILPPFSYMYMIICDVHVSLGAICLSHLFSLYYSLNVFHAHHEIHDGHFCTVVFFSRTVYLRGKIKRKKAQNSQQELLYFALTHTFIRPIHLFPLCWWFFWASSFSAKPGRKCSLVCDGHYRSSLSQTSETKYTIYMLYKIKQMAKYIS